MKILDVTLTRTRLLQPLAIVHNLPGFDAQMTPGQMRSLGKALLIAAEDCESRPMGKRTFIQARRQYPLPDLPKNGGV